MSSFLGPSASQIRGLTGVTVPLYLSRHLDTVGDGSGDKNANGNYAAAVEEFKIVPGATEIFRIARMIIHIDDVGNPGAGTYGAGAVLANGVEVQVKDASGVIIDMTDGMPVKENGDWQHYSYDVSYTTFGPGNAGYVGIRWTFLRGGVALRLDGSAGEYLAARFNDDLTFLTEHIFVVQGYEETVLT